MKRLKAWTVIQVSRWLTALVLIASPLPTMAADVPPESAPRMTAILRETALRLGWPAEVSPRSDLRGSVWQVGSPDGTQTALIGVEDGTSTPPLLDDLRGQGLVLGLYRGREAVISHPNDPLAQGRGVIAWRCGPFVAAAYDDSGTGAEDFIAAALADAAEAHNLCGLPATLVIRAECADARHTGPDGLSRMISASTLYYQANAYGRVDFAFIVVDAPPEVQTEGWFGVGPSLDVFADDAFAFGAAALRLAAASLRPGPMAYVERAIVIVPAGTLTSLTGNSRAGTYREPNGEPLLIPIPALGVRLLLADLVIISEADLLGVWVHELGHTLYGKRPHNEGLHRLADRYCCGQPDCPRGHVGYWDVMGQGSQGDFWCLPPSHMSSFTKEQAGWLRYVYGAPDREYTLTPLEHQRAGDQVLTIASPLADDPRWFYILEARDVEIFADRRLCGVMVYTVMPKATGDHAAVMALPEPNLPAGECEWSLEQPRPSLYGVGDLAGRTRLELPGGLCVELIVEAQEPYRPTVRVTLCP